MAEKKMTRAEAITFAIDNIAANCMDDMEETGANEAIEILEKLYAQITKPRTRKPNTAKRDANVALGEKFAELWNEETFKAADVAKALEVSVPKANAVCKAMGWKQVPSTEKVKVYCL
jgi:hypothetical protein